MAQRAVEDIFSSLDKVFSGEVEYDEALDELGMSVAKVRKAYPSLYNALKHIVDGKVATPSNGGDAQLVTQSQLAELQKNLLAAVAKIPVAVAAPQAPSGPPTTVVPSESIKVDDQPIYPYTEWVRQQMPTSQLGQKWTIRWDVRKGDEWLPPPAAGAVITLRRSDAGDRIRFQVLSIREDENVLVLDTLRFLPPASS